jgi:mono/diheme cytochrome c family protein
MHRCMLRDLPGCWALLPCIVLALPWLACRPAATAAGPTAPAVLYHNYCSVCHGDKGDGRAAPPARCRRCRATSPRRSRRELSRERIAAAITHGRPGTAMVSWKTQLSATDIERLSEYVFNTFVQGQTPWRRARSPAPRPMAGVKPIPLPPPRGST